MVGNSEQIERWQRQTKEMPFGRVRLIPSGDVDYCQMKQAGAKMGTSSILAFVDSDVRPAPRWLTTLKETIESGFGVSVGLTGYHWHGWAGPNRPLMLAFSSVSWGGILGPSESAGPCVLGFHANNVAFRGDLLHTDRACCGHVLPTIFGDRGCKPALGSPSVRSSEWNMYLNLRGGPRCTFAPEWKVC